MGAQEISATPGALDGEILDGVFGDAEKAGDFLLGAALDFSQEDHFALAFREGMDGFGEQCEFLGVAQGLNGALLFMQDRQDCGFRYLHMLGAGAKEEKIANGVACDGEKKGFGRTNPVARLGTKQAEIGFLRDVISVGPARQRFSQIGPERPIMRLHLPDEPRGVVRIGSGGGRIGNDRIGGGRVQGKEDSWAV